MPRVVDLSDSALFVRNLPWVRTMTLVLESADRLLARSAQSNAARALHQERARRTSWQAEADDWLSVRETASCETAS